MDYRVVSLVVYLGLIVSSWIQGGLTVNVLVSDEAKFVVNSNEYLSVSNQYYLAMQSDCNLILYNTLGEPVANSNSASPFLPQNCSLWMQSDGNLVIFNIAGVKAQPVWSQAGYYTTEESGDGSQFSSFLLLGGDGSLNFYNTNSTLDNASVVGINDHGYFPNVGPSAYPKFVPSEFQAWTPTASLDEYPYMPSEYFLSPGKKLRATSNTFVLELGTDCNLISSQVLYTNDSEPIKQLWQSGTNNSQLPLSSCQLTLQQNGVLQIHSSTDSSEVYWNSTDSSGDNNVSWILKVDPDTGALSVSDITNSSRVLWTNPSLQPVVIVARGGSNRSIVGVVGGVGGGALVLAFAALGFCCYTRQRFLDPADKAFQVRLRANGGTSQAFSQATIKRATNNFKNLIGRGGFGDVFYGRLPDGRELAAKVLSANSPQSKHEFYNEIELLSKVHHKFLVSLLGYCSGTQGHQILIYEFMGGGDLRHRLQPGEIVGTFGKYPLPDPLSWQQRKTIILQVAEGLEYLHHKCSPPIIHRDVKSTNILLTTNLDAKVADFGLSKLKAIGQEDATHVTTAVKGTPGYLDPEYHETGLLTEKSDVYAFGVVLLEILTGRHHIYIAQRVLDAWRLEQFDELADPNLGEQYEQEELVKLVEVALWCVRKSSQERPSMDDVVRRLHDLLLPPSEPIQLEVGSSKEDAHVIVMRSIKILLNSGDLSSESVPFNGSSYSDNINSELLR